MTKHPSDPVETPPPRLIHERQGADLDGAIGRGPFRSAQPPDIHECLHLELIDDVRQARKRRTPLTVVVISISVTIVLSVAAILYSQGQAAGSTRVRVDALEQRASEDRARANEQNERQRQQDTIESQRHTELMQAIHGLDSRLVGVEQRLPARGR